MQDHEKRETLEAAAAAERAVSFIYKGAEERRHVIPGDVRVTKAGDLVVVADDLDRDAPRTFQLEGIDDLQPAA